MVVANAYNPVINDAHRRSGSILYPKPPSTIWKTRILSHDSAKASAPFVNRSGLAVLAFARAPCRLVFAVRTGVYRVMSASCYRAAGRVRSAVHVRLGLITKSKCSDEVANQASSPRNRLLKKFLKKGVAPKIEMSIIFSCAKETKRTEEIPR